MKKGYFTTFLLSILAFSLSAQPIQVDTSSNWQQWISGILGGNCVQISNVQFTNQAGSAARFTGGSDIGLSQGIVLSTGAVGPQITAVADLFLNEAYIDFNIDTLLEQYATQEIGYTGNPTSYDATRIEFDFVAPSNQQINIRFVFASEEYPEFAPPNNSFFNDIFGFFVAEQGISGYQNIAKVPGTELPVTIGNINAVTNSQFYNESTNGLQFAYDGFTTPISATFNAIGGVAYHMVIAISDIGDPNFDSSVFLELNSNSSQSVHGTAYVNATPLEASQVKLWGYNTDPAAFDSIAVALTDINGDYTFSSVDQGLYLIQVVPDAVAYPQAIPIYFPGVVLWEDATAVGVTCDSLDLDGPGMIFNTGPGQITGLIGQDPFGGRLRSDDLIPYEGVNVFLQDSASGEWRGYDKTDVNGAFAFENLGFGTYYVIPDVAGVPVDEYQKVVLSDTAFIRENLGFILRDSVFETFEIPVYAPLLNFDSTGIYTVALPKFSPYGGIDMLKFKGDTLIDGVSYHALWADSKNSPNNAYNEDSSLFFAGFRQEGGRLYIRLRTLQSVYDSAYSNREFLYFDTDWATGDTIFSSDNVLIEPDYWGENDPYLIVSQIDTITVNESVLRRWQFEGSYYQDVFVPGFGFASGFTSIGYMQNMACGYPAIFLCYTDSNNFTTTGYDPFNNSNFGNIWGESAGCYLVGGLNEVSNQSAIKAFPNPGNDFLRLETELNLSGNIYMYDISGRMVNSQPVSNSNNIVNTAQLESGVYILSFIDQAGNHSTGKWIKE
jgi:hypothetical protein